ncbi:MAG: MgtC/SapB family protein [Candidatus Odinarchaeota archaeon]
MDAILELELLVRLVLATFLGYVIGLERGLTGHPAGERTHALTALGAAMFTVISIYAFEGDPARVAAGIVTGLGFLGGGIILKRSEEEVQGLTTAAGIWAVGSIGLAIGSGMYLLGIASSVIVGLVLASERLLKIDERLSRWRDRKKKETT